MSDCATVAQSNYGVKTGSQWIELGAEPILTHLEGTL